MKKLTSYLPAYLRFLGTVYLVLVGVFSTFRAVTLLYHGRHYNANAEDTLTLASAFKAGLCIDLSVALYILLLPALVLGFASYFKFKHPRLKVWMRNYIIFSVLVSLLICAADVPYFYFFNSRLNAAAVNLKNLGQAIKFIFLEIRYYPFIILFLGGIWAVRRFVAKVWNNIFEKPIEHPRMQNLSTGFALLLLFSFAVIGRSNPTETLMKSAYFSNDGFLNQLALNPVHTWVDSYWEEFDIKSLPIERAYELVNQSFGTQFDKNNFSIQRQHTFKESAKKPKNVVLILMESMSLARMGYGGDSRNLTPGLDSLMRHSTSFDHCYSNGIHTNAGLYSSLYGMPIMMMQHPMYNGISEYRSFQGLPNTLRDLGYSTSFFCTHPKTFDNLDVFLAKNGYNRISDMADYPQDKIANSWGVGDETLFEYALQNMDSLANAPVKQPFFTTLLTITAHPPYTLPAFTKFKARSIDPVDITYEYADWAVKNFIDSASTRDWFDETIFVFVGDHGFNLHGPTDVPLSYNHVPLIFYAPSILKENKEISDLANQTDIFPTIMGMLQLPYTQNTLGYDLFREKRPYAFFSQDQKLGVTDGEYLYVTRKSGYESLTYLEDGVGNNFIKQQPVKADSMKNYACSMLQVAQYMIKEGR